MKNETRTKIQHMQTLFDRFERWIIQKLASIQAPYMIGVHEELAVLWPTIEEMHARPLLIFPIIDEILVDNVLDI